MSIKLIGSALFLGATVFTVSLVFAKPEAKSRITLINKARGIMNVELFEKSVNGDTVTLEAQVTTKLPSAQIEWKLPDGASLVSGNVSEIVQKNQQGKISSTVTIKVSGVLSKPHVAITATDPNSNKHIGASALYRLAEPNPAASEEKLEMMKNHFKYHQNRIQK